MLLNCMGDIALHYDPSNRRVRQIATEYVTDPATLHRVLARADAFASGHGATRIVIRALTHESCLPSAMAVATSRRYRVESVIPTGSAFADYAFVTYGRNFGCRYSKPGVILQQQQMLFEVRSRPAHRSEASILSEARAAGFTIERLQGVPSEADRRDMVAMICSSLDEDSSQVDVELDALLTGVDTYTVVALRSIRTGRLHSLCVSERKDVPMCDGRTLRLAEKAWAVKHHGADGTKARGLSILLHLALQADAYQHGTHVLFAESRSSLIAINRINHCIGMTAGGMLEKHVEIGGEEDIVEGMTDNHSAYRNMNVWFIRYDELREAGPRLSRLFQSAAAGGAMAGAMS
ncbi:hypothetical protein [Trinickia sp.]|uniref:hypothetical protein n=1 Tax=Trinickia sp. TaxID=2571163 RepID=UPI003F8199AA